MNRTFALDEFFSHTELEKLVVCPPQDHASIQKWVKRFEVMQGQKTHEGEDVLEALLEKRHVSLILLGFLRMAVDTHGKTRLAPMIKNREIFRPLAEGFRTSECDFAKAIFRQLTPPRNHD